MGAGPGTATLAFWSRRVRSVGRGPRRGIGGTSTRPRGICALPTVAGIACPKGIYLGLARHSAGLPAWTGRGGGRRCPIRQVSVPSKASRRSFIPGPRRATLHSDSAAEEDHDAAIPVAWCVRRRGRQRVAAHRRGRDGCRRLRGARNAGPVQHPDPGQQLDAVLVHVRRLRARHLPGARRLRLLHERRGELLRRPDRRRRQGLLLVQRSRRDRGRAPGSPGQPAACGRDRREPAVPASSRSRSPPRAARRRPTTCSSWSSSAAGRSSRSSTA